MSTTQRVDADELKCLVSLAELLQADGHELRRAGANLVCRCPFHDERTGSFTVFPDGGFKCFGCGVAGDVFDYIGRRDGCDFNAAKGKVAALVGMDAGRALAASPRRSPKPASEAAPWTPYVMDGDELARCVAMAEALWRDERTTTRIAKARNWSARTIRELALDPCLGIHDGRLVYIYPTGAKKRLKPLTPALAEGYEGKPFVWMFGAQHSLWRADRRLRYTERVHLTEGETAAITLIDAGLDNQTTEIVMAVPGAQSWRDEWAKELRGLDVTLWPDADDAGEALQRRLIESLSPHARTIEVVSTKAEVSR